MEAVQVGRFNAVDLKVYLCVMIGGRGLLNFSHPLLILPLEYVTAAIKGRGVTVQLVHGISDGSVASSKVTNQHLAVTHLLVEDVLLPIVVGLETLELEGLDRVLLLWERANFLTKNEV